MNVTEQLLAMSALMEEMLTEKGDRKPMDERKEFKKWATETSDALDLTLHEGGYYANEKTLFAWYGWQGRGASLIGWQPIETLPQNAIVLLFFPEGEKGVGGVECSQVYWDGKDISTLSCWSHGGANAGLELELSDTETPTHWMPEPLHPQLKDNLMKGKTK